MNNIKKVTLEQGAQGAYKKVTLEQIIEDTVTNTPLWNALSSGVKEKSAAAIPAFGNSFVSALKFMAVIGIIILIIILYLI